VEEQAATGEKRGKRSNGEGTVSHRKDGRIEVKFTLPNGKRACVYGRNRGEALAKKDEALKKAKKGINLKAERQSLEVYLESWFRDIATPKNRPSTLKSYRSYLDRHIIPELGDVALCDLTPTDVHAFLNSRTNAGLSPRSVQYIRAILRTALTQAMRWGYVERNVAALASPPRMVRMPVRPLNAEQAQRLIENTREDRLGLLFAAAVYTGLRQGELLGLRWQDLDLDAGTLTVRQAVQKIDGAWQFVEPKSDRGRRTLPLPPRKQSRRSGNKSLGSENCERSPDRGGSNGASCSRRRSGLPSTEATSLIASRRLSSLLDCPGSGSMTSGTVARHYS
jgi:integrase